MTIPKRAAAMPASRPRSGRTTFGKGGQKPSCNIQKTVFAPLAGFTHPAIRAKQLIAKYQSDEILALAERIQNGKAKNEINTQDAIIITHLARALRDGIERERLYDRTFGKVPDRSVNLNIDADTDADQLSDKAMDLLATLTD